jgi:hypothetical protein
MQEGIIIIIVFLIYIAFSFSCMASSISWIL